MPRYLNVLFINVKFESSYDILVFSKKSKKMFKNLLVHIFIYLLIAR